MIRRFVFLFSIWVLIPALTTSALGQSARKAIHSSSLDIKNKQSISASSANDHGRGFRLPAHLAQVKPGGTGISRVSQALTALPASLDWSTKNPARVSPVTDQGQTNTCWLFATIGEVESRVMITDSTSSAPDYSEQDVVNYFPYEDSFTIGGDEQMVVSYLAQYGTVNESVVPWLGYARGTWNPNTPHLKNVTKWNYYGDLSGTSTQNVTFIKNLLLTGPVYTSICVSALRQWGGSHGLSGDSWGTVVVPSTVQVADPASSNDHAEVIVGWDDTKAQYGSSATGAWKIRNSWGSGWGVGGYEWVGYGAAGTGFAIGQFPAGGIQSREKDMTVISVDKGWAGDAAGFSNTWTDYMAVRYTLPTLPLGRNVLNAVDIAACYPNEQYEIRIYSDFDTTAQKPVGSPLATQTGSFTNAGYFAVTLSSPVTVRSGQSLCIWVKLTNPNHDPNEVYILPTSETSSNLSSTCFYSDSGATGAWSDLHTDANRELVLRGRISNLSGVSDWAIYN